MEVVRMVSMDKQAGRGRGRGRAPKLLCPTCPMSPQAPAGSVPCNELPRLAPAWLPVSQELPWTGSDMPPWPRSTPHCPLCINPAPQTPPAPHISPMLSQLLAPVLPPLPSLSLSLICPGFKCPKDKAAQCRVVGSNAAVLMGCGAEQRQRKQPG